MSYCRFTEGDVYAYECEGGVQFYVSGKRELDRLCSTFNEAYQYAKSLRDAHGLDVPSHAIEALKADALEEAARICGPDSAVVELEIENTKLRMLVRDMHRRLSNANLCAMCPDSEACGFDALGGRCTMLDDLEDCMRDLGIEVRE